MSNKDNEESQEHSSSLASLMKLLNDADEGSSPCCVNDTPRSYQQLDKATNNPKNASQNNKPTNTTTNTPTIHNINASSSSSADACGNGTSTDGKKYIWDEILHDNDTNSFSDLHNNYAQWKTSTMTTMMEDEKSNDERLEMEYEREVSIRDKIKKMKCEHELKSKQVIELKTVLARKKVAYERKRQF